MPFPSNPSPGDQYPNTDNGILYEWQDPPGAWNAIGTIDDGNTPGGPGEGLVEGTEPRFQWFTVYAPGAASHSADDISVRVDGSKVLSSSQADKQEFAYSYDLANWNLGTLTGGTWTDNPVNIARGASGGGQLWVTKENGNGQGFFKSTDGINWTVSTITGPASNHNQCGVSRGNVLLTSNGTALADLSVWYSADQGATWSSNNLNYKVARDSTFIDDDVAIIGQRDGTTCRVSIDGGATFTAMTGTPTGISNWNQMRITGSVSGPKIYYAKDINSNSGNLYYVTLAALEAGNMAWAPLTGGSNLFTDSTPQFFQCYSVSDDNYIVEITSFNRALIMKLSSNGTSLDDWRLIRPLSSSSSTTGFYTSIMYSMPQPAKMILGRSSSAVFNSGQGAIAGFSPDLYFNGIKMEFSSMLRTDFS